MKSLFEDDQKTIRMLREACEKILECDEHGPDPRVSDAQELAKAALYQATGDERYLAR